MGHRRVTNGSTPLGDLILQERQRRGLTRGELAELVRRADRTLLTNHKAVERWELRGHEPQPAALRALATVLQRPVEELTELARQPATPPEDRLSLATYSLVSGAVDWRTLIPELQQATDRLCRLYAVRAPADLVPRVQERARLVQGLLRHGARQHQRELVEVGGWLLLLLGTLHVDLDQQEAAWFSRDVAYRMGLELGHSELIGWCMETASWMSLIDGLWPDVLQAAEEGARLSPPRSSPKVQNTLKIAQAQAALGDLRAAERTIDAAAEVVAGMDPTERPEHHFVFDPAKFEMFAAQVYTEAGAPAKAAEHARICIARSDDPASPARYHPRRASAARVDLAAALLRMGGLDGACAAASDAISAPFLGKHTLVRVGTLLARMRDRYPSELIVGNLAEQYREATVTR